MAATTAFTPVAARRTLGHTPSAVRFNNWRPHPASTETMAQALPPSNPPTTRKVDWPQPVREYVQRSFAPESLIPGIEIKEMEVKLRKVITDAAESNKLDEIDWATLPLPQQIIQQERAMASWHTQTTTDTPWETSEALDYGASRKRKLDEGQGVDGETSPPPWRKDAKANGFGDRITYANQAQANKMEKRVRKQQDALGKGTSKYQAAIEKRKQRFGNHVEESPPWSSSRDDTPTVQAPTGPVIGTCQTLEKNYFRLTSPPKPEEVRPQEVLEKTFELIKKKWTAEGNYVYVCDQFKSLRQDLTVQHIKNKFTVSVYELHARIALERGDLGEYNQCQTQLRALYSLGIEGHPAEFLAYRILYFIHTCNRTGMNDVLADISPEDKQKLPIKHALAVRSAQASGNYHKLLAELYQSVPNMGAYLMDMFVTRERFAALAVICRAYKPFVSGQFLTEELGFESYQQTLDFLKENGAEQIGALDESGFRLETSKAAALFERAKASAFHKVDIKGQI